jgi:hypothetical protein
VHHPPDFTTALRGISNLDPSADLIVLMGYVVVALVAPLLVCSRNYHRLAQ